MLSAGIEIERIRRVAGDLIDDEQRGFREGRGYVDQVFTLKKMGESTLENV